MRRVDIKHLNELINQMKEKRESLDEIIRPFLNENNNRKQNVELCQVGKLLTLLDGTLSILDRRESPDFIICYNGETIGLEHEEIVDRNLVKSVRSIEKLFQDAADVFAKKYPKNKILANIWIKDVKFKNEKRNAEKIQNEIADYIYLYLSNPQTDKPYFIDDVLIMKYSGVSFIYNSGGHVVQSLDNEKLMGAISKKERLLNSYRLNSKIERQWLLLMIGRPTPDSFEFYNGKLPVNIYSNFERIYLLEDMAEILYRIK